VSNGCAKVAKAQLPESIAVPSASVSSPPMLGSIGLVAAATAEEAEPSTAASILVLLLAVVIGVVIYKMSKKRKAERLERVSAMVHQITDMLVAEGEVASRVVAVKISQPYVDKKGQAAMQWVDGRVLALTHHHLTVFTNGTTSRETTNLSDVMSTATAGNDLLTVTFSNGARYSFAPVWAGGLHDVGKDIQAATRRLKDGVIGATSGADELARLAELRDQGIIDASDWNRAKDLYLGKTESERDRAARELRQLHDLHRSGVLSASEFNMKKWDILSRTS